MRRISCTCQRSKKLPAVDKACGSEGVFKAADNTRKAYCDLFYWCSKKDESPVYFYCDIDFLTQEAAVFNLETKRCELKPASFCKSNENVYSNTLRLKASFFVDKIEDSKRTEEEPSSNSILNYQMNLNKISDYVSMSKLPYSKEAQTNNTSV